MDWLQFTLLDTLFGLFVVGFSLIYWCKYKYCFDSRLPKCVTNVCGYLSSDAHLKRSTFVEIMYRNDLSILVLYASQTGTAFCFAQTLQSNLFDNGLRPLCLNIEDLLPSELLKLAELPHSLAIFIVATYGEGEPTDSARHFVEWLEHSSMPLTGLTFAVFGLGSSAYSTFNACATLIDRKMHRRGGVRFADLVLADELDNMEATFTDWQAKLTHRIIDRLQKSKKLPPNPSYKRLYKTIPVPQESVVQNGLFVGEPLTLGSYRYQKPPFSPKNPFLAPILVNRELLLSGDRSCRHVELDITGAEMRYQPGDHVAVLPNNPKDLVQRFADLFKIELDDTVNFQAISEFTSCSSPFPCPCSYRTALTHYVDLAGPPRLNVLLKLSYYASDEREARLLRTLGSITPESKRQYKEWILEERRNIVDVVQTMSSVNIPVDVLLESLPRLKPRFYSISSSLLRYTDRLHLTAVVVKEETPSGRLFKGLTTSWFSSLPSKDANPESQNRSFFIPIYLQTSSFHLPRSRNIPIIMIAAGTGLAPFCAFIQERAELNRIKGSMSAAMLLFFGCRRKSDYLYADELESARRSGLLELYVTFSRDPADGKKSYVQDRMLQMADKIWHLLDESHAHLYICGSAVTMARDVHACLLRIIHTTGKLSAIEAKVYLDRLKTDGRYHMDVWG
ncbi:hypothetical protein P879_01587 [Paragonimus westermani]|uniref:NADPH--hemoprotein reductase n=1 Tax=Paragonimus westermani TaxID=34504 RepID=A0A8T0DTV6_9TREM|nr:hypothetical protein P879_01587 [Paragonimus westermani]